MNNRQLVGPFLGIAAWIVLSGPAIADDLSDIVARYRLWRGGAAFEGMRAVRLEGRATTSGLNGPMSILATAQGDLRRDLDLGVLQTIDVRQGAGGWNLTQSGQIEALAPDVAADLYRDAVLLFDDVLDDPARLTVRPDVALDGRTFDVLAVDFGDADAHELYFDETDGALYGMRIMRDRQEGFTRFDDWRFVEGVRMPFAQTTIKEGESPVSVSWSEIDIDPEVQQSAFERPQIAPLHSIAGDARSTGFLPFEFLGGTRIYIPATVGMEQTEVLLDSGAEMTVLDLALARRLGLTLEGEVVVQGTGGLATGQFASGVDIQLGPLAFHDLTVLVLDLEPIARAFGRQLPVLLGKDAFNALIVDVDFPNRRIAFHEIDGFTPPEGAAEIDLVSTGDIRAVRLSIEGRSAELFDFDTGNGGGLIIYPAYAEAEGLLDGRMSTTTRGGRCRRCSREPAGHHQKLADRRLRGPGRPHGLSACRAGRGRQRPDRWQRRAGGPVPLSPDLQLRRFPGMVGRRSHDPGGSLHPQSNRLVPW